MNVLNNSELIYQEYSSRVRFSLPYNNQKLNNISFKNSVHMVNNSEKRPSNHRQYLIDFIRDNNNKNRKSPLPKQIISNKNENSVKNLCDLNKEIIDKNFFFNDYFNKQKKLEIREYNKKNTEKLIDIFEYIGEDSKRPIDIEMMNIKMHNFIPGRISSKSFGLINSYAANTNQGIDRNYNDDRVKIMINMNRPINYMKKAPWPLISFFGIFDGHNGDHCAEFLRQNLLEYIYTNPNFPKNIEKSIKEAFIQADKDYLKNFLLMKDTNINMNDIVNSNYHLDYYNNSGSCGLILLLVDTKIYIANVGDSRCLISCENGKIQKDVTRDHKPEFPYEKKRIYDNGGNIYRNETVFNEDFQNKSHNKILLGPYRVNPGKLSVSRTIGDAKAKIKKLGGIPNVIIPEPDVYVFDYYKDNIDYFILGCDGIFDRLKSYEVFKCANIIIDKSKEILEDNKFNHCFNTSYDKKINMNTTCGNIVDMILRASMLRKSYDNVTCIIVAFKDLLFENNSNELENENNINLKNEKKEKLINKRNTKVNIIDNNESNTFNYNYNNISKETNRYDNENDEKNINIDNFTYKVISKYNNTYNNNFIYIDNKSKDRNNNNKSDNNNINEYNINHRRIPSQSQEKKIRELISLFSINNKKGINNDNSKLLYRSYGSTNDIIKNQPKLEKENDKKEMTLPNKNILTLSKDNLNRKIENERLQKNKLFKKNYLEIKTNGNNNGNYSYIKRNKSITNSIKIDNDNEKNNNIYNNSFKNGKDKEYNNNEKKNNNYKSNNIRIKTSSINTLYQTPTKVENFGKRITTRKIVRKSNNIFNLKNNLIDKVDNNNNQDNVNNLTLNTRNNHIFPFITPSNNENNELIKSTENLKNLKNLKNSSINIDLRKNNINYYEKYKYRNLRYNSNNTNTNNSNDKQIYVKDKEDNKGNKEIINKSGKYENERIQKINLPLSSSVGLIYTKKNKIK